jgi:hypothetical protein
MVETQFEKWIKMIRSDNGTKYVNENLEKFFLNKGVLHEISCVGTSKQNVVVVWKKKYIFIGGHSVIIAWKQGTIIFLG